MIKSWPFLTILSKVEKCFFIFAFNFIHLVAIVLILSTDQGDLTQGVCLLAKFRPVFSITNFKKPNKHTPGVQSACTITKTTVVEQKEYNILSQILEGNRKITNDEFLSLCGQYHNLICINLCINIYLNEEKMNDFS